MSKLHICTPLYRQQYLNDIYNSIPKHDDIIWHICKTTTSEKLTNDFLNDKRVIVYEIDCNESDTTSKRNRIFDEISEGYFCLLDDDTIFLEHMYNVYVNSMKLNTQTMIIGRQLYKNGTRIRLTEHTPRFGKIDTGNVLSHYSCLTKCRWPITENNAKDYLFWLSVFKFYNENVKFVKETISIYNKLR